MQPDFLITADSTDITERIKQRILSLRITDEAGIQADTLELSLDDEGNSIEWPRIGVKLDVLLGYANAPLIQTGAYVVDEVEHSGPPDTLTIRAKAIDTVDSIKQPKTRSWHGQTLGSISATIASEHGLNHRINPFLESISIPHVDQTEESDLHFLLRLTRRNGGITKVANKSLIVVMPSESTTASEQALPEIDIPAQQIIDHRMTQAERGRYQTVIAHWHNSLVAQRQPVSVGDGKPAFTLRHTYADEAQAKRAAQDKLNALNRGVATLSLTILGDASLQAEGKVNITDLRDPIRNRWLVKRLEHQVNSGGFSTRLEMETPNAS